MDCFFIVVEVGAGSGSIDPSESQTAGSDVTIEAATSASAAGAMASASASVAASADDAASLNHHHHQADEAPPPLPPHYLNGHLAGIHKWDLGSHLNSITIHHEPSSSPVASSGHTPDDGGDQGNHGDAFAKPSDQVYLLLAQHGGDVLRFSFKAASHCRENSPLGEGLGV
jgi:hypothetical protein